MKNVYETLLPVFRFTIFIPFNNNGLIVWRHFFLTTQSHKLLQNRGCDSVTEDGSYYSLLLNI